MTISKDFKIMISLQIIFYNKNESFKKEDVD